MNNKCASICFSLQGGVITEMVMGIPVEHLDHMVGEDVDVAGAVGQILMVMAGVTGRTKTVVHKGGVPRMAMVVVDGGVASLDQKPRIHRAVVVGEAAVVVVMLVRAAALVGVAGEEMLVVRVRMQVIQGGEMPRRVQMVVVGDKYQDVLVIFIIYTTEFSC